MTLVIDASVVVAALVDTGATGQWAELAIAEDNLYAPHLMPFEVANVLRRLALAGAVSEDVSSLAYADFLRIPFDLIAHELLADRIWELRSNLTAYDASYVALAESLGAPLATLDLKLTQAPTVGCQFRVPD